MSTDPIGVTASSEPIPAVPRPKDKRRRTRSSRTPWFDPDRVPATERMAEVVKEVYPQVLNAEAHHRTRRRPRKAADAAMHAATAERLLSDLAYRNAEGRDGIAVMRDNNSRRKSRYRSEIQNSHLPALLDVLEYPLGFIEQEKGYRSQFGNMPTIIRPTERLLSRIRGMSIMDVCADRLRNEVVVLKDTKYDRREWLEYEDTDETNYYRAQVRRINGALADADIEYLQDISNDGFQVDVRETYLHRTFSRSSFRSGGRLFGGWWLPLGKEERLANTLINGESVVSLDYKSMGPMLAYAAIGMTPPTGDLYPTGFTSGSPDAATQVRLKRSVVKKLFNACLFCESPLKAWPRGLQVSARGVHIAQATATLVQAHPALASVLFTGIGHQLQFVESTILVEVLMTLIDRGIAALPVHDCVVVAASAQDEARGVMLSTFKKYTDLDTAVAVESAAEE